MKIKPPTYNPKDPILWAYVSVSASFAVVLGIALLMGWLQVMWTAPIGWLVLTAVWVWLVNFRELKRPFLHLLFIGLIGGFIAGLVPMLFHETYVENGELDRQGRLGSTISDMDKLQVLYMNVGYGAIFGALGGFVADRMAKRRPAPPPPSLT